MPIHRGPRLDDLISRLPYAIPIQANIYKTWPNLASEITITSGDPSSWVEFISAASAPTSPFTVTHVWEAGDIGSCTVVEIGIGSAGNETAVAMCAIASYNSNDGFGVVSPLPYIPGGSRVTIRTRSTSVSGGPGFKIVTALLPTTQPKQSSLQQSPRIARWYPGLYGIHGTSASGTTSATPWTYGSYIEVAAATVESSAGIMVAVQLNNLNGGVGQIAYATGASGSEVVWGEFPFGALGGRIVNYPLPIPVFCPGSTRHAAKCAMSGASAVGFYWPCPIFSKGIQFP